MEDESGSSIEEVYDEVGRDNQSEGLMCFHMKQSSEAQKLKKRFNAEVKAGYAKHRPSILTDSYIQTPVICGDAPGLIREASWGWCRFGLKTKAYRSTQEREDRNRKEKPSFRGAVDNRCLIIADGFYEWQWLTASEAGSRST